VRITFAFYECNNLGIEYLSAYLKNKGHEVALSFDPALFRSFTIHSERLHKIFDYKEVVVDQIVNSKPDLVGFSVVSDIYGWACEVAQEVKKRINVPVIFGGIHPSSVPEIVIAEDFVDYVCVGEGEEALLDLMSALERKQDTTKIKNIWAKKNGQVIDNPLRSLTANLDEFPFPDKELFYRHYPGFKSSYNIITARGCPFKCSFCYNSLILKKYGMSYLRQRSVDNVLAELKEAKKKFGIKRVFFVDDMFAYDPIWFEEFCRRYLREVGLPFTCEIHPSVTEEIVEKLKISGCVAVDIGVQTISEDIRKNILGRNETNDQIIKTLKLFMNTNIYVYVDIILGIPSQDKKELIDIIKFLKTYRPDYVLVNWLRCYPRTGIVNLMERGGLLSEEQVKEIDYGKEYMPFTYLGNTFDSETGKLGNLILISQMLPKRIIELLIRKGWYKKLNSSTFLPLRLYAIVVSIYSLLFSSKKRLLYFTPTWQLKYYAYWSFKKILMRFTKRKKVREER